MKNKILIIIFIILLTVITGYFYFAFLKPKNEIPKTPRGGAIEGAAVEAGSAGL